MMRVIRGSLADASFIAEMASSGVMPSISFYAPYPGSALGNQLIAEGAIDAGMIPKVQACLETLNHGVNKVHIIDGRIRHSLLLEVYTSKGVGTQIVRS